MSALLGTLGVELTGDTGKLDDAIQEATSAIKDYTEKVSDGTSKAEADFKQLGDEGGSALEELGEHAAKGAAVAAAALTAIGAVAYKALEEIGQSEEATARLVATIHASGADIDASAITDYAGEMQKLTKFSDEETTSAAAMLVSFKLTQDQVLGLLPRLQDLVSVFGGDLPSAAEQMGRAIETGNISVRGMHIALSDAEKEAFQAADANERLAMIMEKLQSTVDGAATAMGETATGSFARLKNAAGEVWEGIGAVLERSSALHIIFEKLQALLERVAAALRSVAGETKAIAQLPGGAAGTAPGHAAAEAGGTMTAAPMGPGFDFTNAKEPLMMPMTVAAPISQFDFSKNQGGGTGAFSVFGDTAIFANDVNDGFKTMAEVVDANNALFSQAIDKTEGLGRATDEATTAIKSIWPSEEASAAMLRESIARDADNFGQAVTAFTDGLGQSIARMTGPLGHFVDTLIEGGSQGGVWGALGALVGSLLGKLDGFKAILDKIMGALGGLLGKLLGPIFDALGPLIDALGNLAGIVGEVLNPVMQVLGWVISIVALVIESIIFVIAKAVQGIADALGWLFDFDTSGLDNAVDALGQNISDTADRVAAGPGGTVPKHATDQAAAGAGDGLGAVGDAGHHAADGMDHLSKTMDRASASLDNVPSGFKVALDRFNSAAPSTAAAFTANGKDMNVAQVTIGTIISQAKDPDQLFKELSDIVKRQNVVQSGSILGGRTAPFRSGNSG